MKQTDFVATLMPSFERSRVTSLLADTRAQVNENLLPLYRNAVETLAGKPAASQPAKALGAFMATHLHMRYATNPLQGVLVVLEGLPERLEKLEEQVHKTFGKDVVREALTYRAATLLQYINSVAFVAEYAGPLLDRIVAAELAVSNKEPAKVDAHLLPAMAKYLSSKMNDFGDALTLSTKPIGEIIHEIEHVPDITIIPDNESVVAATVGADKLDPLKFGFFGLSTNPAYFIGKWWADRQVASYAAAVEERKTVELRLLALRQSFEGRQDPALEQQIKYNEGRVEELTRKVRKMEEQWS